MDVIILRLLVSTGDTEIGVWVKLLGIGLWLGRWLWNLKLEDDSGTEKHAKTEQKVL